ncbi:HAD hydrolase-like protein [Nonomuraea phyllanthi]|uniref:HAD hydrolase-like protein n=1 Tax=Nonomuraea phyllanthi TaxID=2219224 RepID=A0A5C4WBL0_9ACTN|nr:HAD family hydrolase [Nonomuraea phyllanthi]KAB8192577.1 HAD hydrolase-like protein [Nonomuraea phyllanthi]QFY08054.1 HAD hydrolase-like protein [Nonomuraea phyllanthi]
MTTHTGPLAVQDAMRKAECVLLDFDGPICDIFAGLPAPRVAASLRSFLTDHDVEIPAEIEAFDDPLAVFRFSWQLGRDMSRITQDILTTLEVEAVKTAHPTPGAADVIRQSKRLGKSVAVVSNNSTMAVIAYLQRTHLREEIDYVSARVNPDPNFMKPNPHLVRQALERLAATPSATILVGDSMTDMEVCLATGVVAVGYANRPGKASQLEKAGANYVVTSMTKLLVTDSKETR